MKEIHSWISVNKNTRLPPCPICDGILEHCGGGTIDTYPPIVTAKCTKCEFKDMVWEYAEELEDLEVK